MPGSQDAGAEQQRARRAEQAAGQQHGWVPWEYKRNASPLHPAVNHDAGCALACVLHQAQWKTSQSGD